MNIKWNDLMMLSKMIITTVMLHQMAINRRQTLSFKNNKRFNVVLNHCYMLSVVVMQIVLIVVVYVINVLFNIQKIVKEKMLNAIFANKSYFCVGIMQKVVS